MYNLINWEKKHISFFILISCPTKLLQTWDHTLLRCFTFKFEINKVTQTVFFVKFESSAEHIKELIEFVLNILQKQEKCPHSYSWRRQTDFRMLINWFNQSRHLPFFANYSSLHESMFQLHIHTQTYSTLSSFPDSLLGKIPVPVS